MKRSSQRREGFTLVELLVVVAIIALLASILAPSLRRAAELARRGVCIANQQSISLAANQYAAENNQRFPEARTFGPNAVTNRTGWIGWTDVRGAFEPHVSPNAFYCPSLNPNMSPRDPRDLPASVTCGWSVHPTGKPGDYSAMISYTLLGCYKRIGQEQRAAYMPVDQALYDPPSGFPHGLPLIPDNAATADPRAPMISEYVHSKSASSLTDLVDGPFITDPALDTGFGTTKVGAHIWNGTFDGMATTFMDGHSEWRGPGEAGPRAFVNNGGAGFPAVYWW